MDANIEVFHGKAGELSCDCCCCFVHVDSEAMDLILYIIHTSFKPVLVM